MTNDFLNQFSIGGSESLESFQEFCEINARTARKLAGIQLELANLGVESSLAQTRVLRGSSGYGNVVHAQPQLASEYCNRLFEIGCEAMGALYESRDQVLAWVNRNGVQRAVPAAAAAVKTTRRPAKRKASRRKAA